MKKAIVGIFALIIVGMLALSPTVFAEEYETVILFEDSFDDDEVDFDDLWESDNEALYDVVGASNYMKIMPFNDNATTDFDYIENNAIYTQEEWDNNEFTITFDVAYENDDVNYSGLFTMVDDNDDIVFLLWWNGDTLKLLYDVTDDPTMVDTEVDFDDATDFKNVKITLDREAEYFEIVITDGSKVEYNEEFDNVGELDDGYMLAFAYLFNPDDITNATFVEDKGRMYVDDIQLSYNKEIVRDSGAEFILEYWYMLILGGIALGITAYFVADTESDSESLLWGTGVASAIFGGVAWLMPSLFDHFWMWFVTGLALLFGSNAIVGHRLMHDWENEKLERMFVSSWKVIAIVLVVAVVYLYGYYYL